MSNSELNRRYFDWMCQLIYSDKYSRYASFRMLFMHLHSIEFTYILEMDSNRASDGHDLRYRFGYERGYEYSTIDRCFNGKPCTVFEMMVALAMRCEETIMYDPDNGNRIDRWFWVMIESLGLAGMDDNHYDETYVNRVINTFLNRQYDRSGRGGLFTLNLRGQDMRKIDIWYQMNWYICSLR